MPVHITHLSQRPGQRLGARRLLELVEEHAKGMDLTFDTFPYRYGSTRVLIMFPQWAHDGGPEKLKEVMRSEEGRERLRREVGTHYCGWDDLWLTYFKQPHNKRYEGRSVGR